jgi:microcystin-dependent protein
MLDQFMGEIRMFAGNFAPDGWMFCRGQTLSVGQNQDLFSLLGTTYGGNGQSTFMLPDLRSRIPIHVNAAKGILLGKKEGTETTTLTAAQLPKHTHPVKDIIIKCTEILGNSKDPSSCFPALNTDNSYNYRIPTDDKFFADDALVSQMQTVTGGQPVKNIMPYLGISYIIAVKGIFPNS